MSIKLTIATLACVVGAHYFGVGPSWALKAIGTLSVISYFVVRPPKRPTHAPSADNAILITGAAGGLGKHAALAFAKAGYFVYAGVRKDADGKMLIEASNNSPLIKPIILDISNDTHIANAQATLTQDGKSLIALINNAAKAEYGPMELSDETLLPLFQINYFGTVHLTNALLPLIRKSSGRVVFISSIAGKVSSLGGGVYSSSKFALEAAADAYRHELGLQNIAVSLIEPGFIDTSMPQGMAAGLQDWRAHYPNIPEATLNIYSKLMDNFSKQFSGLFHQMKGTPSMTTAAMFKAVTSGRPATRYLVGVDANIFAFLKSVLPDTVMDRLSMAGH